MRCGLYARRATVVVGNEALFCTYVGAVSAEFCRDECAWCMFNAAA